MGRETAHGGFAPPPPPHFNLVCLILIQNVGFFFSSSSSSSSPPLRARLISPSACFYISTGICRQIYCHLPRSAAPGRTYRLLRGNNIFSSLYRNPFSAVILLFYCKNMARKKCVWIKYNAAFSHYPRNRFGNFPVKQMDIAGECRKCMESDI